MASKNYFSELNCITITENNIIRSLSENVSNNIERGYLTKILVVDDNKDIVEMVSDILSPQYDIIKADNVKEALDILKKTTLSLIITDLMMPEIDGYAFIEILRNDKICKRIPIIVLSAKNEDFDMTKGYDIGADAYITKPFSSDVLTSIVGRFLENKEEMKEYYDSPESSFEYFEGKLFHEKDKAFVDEVLSIIAKNISNSELGSDFIASQMGLSSRNLYRYSKKILDISPTQLIKDCKLNYAAKLLVSSNLSVKEIIYKIGITNKTYFYNEFSKKYNMSPKQYKGNNIGRIV